MINTEQLDKNTQQSASTTTTMPNDNICNSTQLVISGTTEEEMVACGSSNGTVKACTDEILDGLYTVQSREMDDLQETLRTLSIGRSSPLRMRSVSPSPPPPSGDPCSLSPGPERRRAATYSAGQLIRPRVRGIRRRLDHHGAERGSSGGQGSWFSPPRPLPQVKSQPRTSPAHRRHLPRDPIQPSTGSISDLSDRHSSAGEGDDENESDRDDHFSLTAHPHFRPRAKTCPENRAWRRRKLKAMNRPPTPPPTSSPTLGLISSSLDVPGSPCRSPLGGSMERLRSSRDLPSFEEEDDV